MHKKFNIALFEFIGMIQKLGFDMTESYQPNNLSKLEYTLLEQLYYKENQSLNDLKAQFVLSESTLRRHLKSFLEKDLITRYPNPDDKRKWLYNITKDGKGILDACYFDILQSVQDKYSHLDNESMKNAIECMTYIKRILNMESQ